MTIQRNASRTKHRRAQAVWQCFAIGLMVLSSVQHARADVGGLFASGRTHIAIYGGTGYAFDEKYFVFGLSVAYYVANGLALGLAAESWSGAEPGIQKISPSVTYVFHQASGIKPYLGVFYRKTYIETLPDLDSAGGRIGVFISSGRNAYLGAGAVYETYLDCNESVYVRCDDVYPELSLTLAF